MRQNFRRAYEGVAEVVTPVLTESHFEERGVLTPEEFVEAGDMLVFKFPTWSWETGLAEKKKSFLPGDKQFLVTKGVPCVQRVAALLSDLNVAQAELEVVGGELDDGSWLATHVDNANPIEEGDMKGSTGASAEAGKEGQMKDRAEVSARAEITANIPTGDNFDDDEEYADLSTFEEDNLLADDLAAMSVQDTKKSPVPNSSSLMDAEEGEVVPTRRYDLSITYDKYYQTPHIWLIGYDETGRVLKPEEVFEDIMQDYTNKTVTIEAHPHLGAGACASIHPCKHASVMKKIIDRSKESGKKARVEQYILVFLKFIQSVIPTINYDHTMEVDATT
jgi:ubiquitin-like-conjugating enzyme ATG3